MEEKTYTQFFQLCVCNSNTLLQQILTISFDFFSQLPISYILVAGVSLFAVHIVPHEQTNVSSGQNYGQQFGSVGHVLILFGIRSDRQPSMEIRERRMGKNQI